MDDLKFLNTTFWDDFHERMNFESHSLPEKLNNLSDMIEDATLDYKFNRDCQRTFPLLTLLETSINKIFDNLPNHSMSEAEIEELTGICRKINEDKIFQLIRDSYVPETLAAQNQEKVQNVEQPGHKALHFDKDGRQHGSENNTLLTTEMYSSPRAVGSLQIDSHDARLTERPMTTVIVEEEKEKEEDVTEKIRQLLKNMEYEYSEHKIDKAFRVLQEIRALIKENQSQNSEISLLTEPHKLLIEDVQNFYDFASKVLHEMQDDHGYQLEKIKNHFSIKYKAEKGEKVILKMEGSINVSLFNILALVNEPEGFPKWMPFCTEGRPMKQLTRTSKIFYAKLSMPPPICGREWYTLGAGFDRLEANGSILVTAKSIHHDKDFQVKHELDIPLKSKVTRMELDFMAMEVIPIARDKVHVKILQKMDPKIKYLPNSILNWTAKKTGQQLLERLLKKATHLKGSLWERKIQENREFYGFLEERVEHFLQSHGL